MKRIVIFTMILALGLAACSKVQDLTPEITPASVLTFQTVSVDTKTVLSGKSVNWLATDAIKVFNAEGASAEFTTSAEKISGTSATFSGTLEASSRYYALFPYDADATISEGKITTVVPYTVKAETAGSFDSSSNVAVATTTGTDLAFKNVLSYIKLDLSEESDVTEVMLRSKDATKYLSGKVEITVADAPTVSVVDGIPFVRLVPAAGNATITPGIYYVPVIPATLSSGISVRVKKAGGLYLKESANVLTASRNIPVAMPKIATAGFEYYKELTVCDGNGGFGESPNYYREYGATSPGTDLNLPNLGDNDKSTIWLSPSTTINASNGGAAAYYMNGTETKRGPYLRLDFYDHKATKGTRPFNEAYIFEYDAYGSSQYDPVVLRIQEYNIGHKTSDGDSYGILAELTKDTDALPAQASYKDCYVSDKIVRPVKPEQSFYGIILCCTKTATCNDLISNYSGENKWGMSNLRVWVHEKPGTYF